MARTVWIAGAVVAVAASTVLLGVGSDEELEGGPLTPPEEHVWGAKVGVGESFTDGLEVIVNQGATDAVLDSVELDADPEIELLDVKLVKPGRKAGFIQQMPWPPKSPELSEELVVPAAGATIRPSSEVQGEGYELLVGLRVDQEGYFVRDGLWLNYSVGDTEYRRYFPAVLTVCSGDVHAEERWCPPPEGW